MLQPVCAHDDNTLIERGPQSRDLEKELGGSQLSAFRSMDKGVGAGEASIFT